MKKICLETSSYLPLIWCTPYTQSIIDYLKKDSRDAEFYIQKDCIIEAQSYVEYPNNWFRHAPFRLRKIAQLNDKVLQRMSFPSSAFQILLGGKMWAQGLYLNFVRHTTFLYADLVDAVDFTDKKKGLTILADLIDERYKLIKAKIKTHLNSEQFDLDLNEIHPYWGFYYLNSDELPKVTIKVWDSEDTFLTGNSRIRDVYHYESMLKSNIKFDKMIVANTGFNKHIKKELKEVKIEIECAYSRQTVIFE